MSDAPDNFVNTQNEIGEDIFNSEFKFTYLYYSGNSGLLVLNATTRKIIDADAVVTKLVNTNHSEIAGKDLYQIGIFKTAEENSEYFSILETQGNYFAEVEVSIKDEIKYFEISANNFSESNQQLIKCRLTDISKRKSAEQKLKISEEKFSALVRATTQFVWTSDNTVDDQKLQNWWTEQTGQSMEEGGDLGWIRVLHPDDQERTHRVCSQAFADKTFFEVSYRIKTKKGDYSHFDVRGVPLFNSDGSFRQWIGTFTDITETKTNESQNHKLIRELADLKFALDESSIVAITDAKGLITYANDKFCEISGYSEAELIGQNHNIINSGFHQKEFFTSLWKTILSGNIWKGEIKNKAKNGDYYWVDTTIVPFLNENEKPYQFIAIRNDITKRKYAEEHLLKEIGYNETFINSLPGIFYLFDQSQKFLRWNDNFEQITGYSTEEISHISPLDLFRGDDIVHISERIMEVFEKGESTAEANLVAKDGTTIPYYFTGKIIEYEQKICLVGMGIDLVERRKSEKALNFQAHLLDTVGQAVIATDLNGQIIYWNKFAETLYGWDFEEVINKNAYELLSEESIHNSENKRRNTEIFRLLRTEKSITDEINVRDKFGRVFPAEVTNSPILDEKENLLGIISVSADLTERKLAEKALRVSEEHLQQAQKLESIGRLAGGIAHDFNNMLTAINGYSDLALRRLSADDPLRRNIEEIKKAGERSAELTHQLLAFSRQQMMQPKIISLNDAVSEMSSLLRRLIGEDIILNIALNPSAGKVRFDPGQLSQVIVNLVVNSRDAMSLGGTLTIETANVYLDNNYSKQHLDVKPGHYVMLAVTDTGVGIDIELQEHIFEPFFTTKELGKGTGLGLATVYGIVKQSGGHIWVYSEIGHGATFKIYIPKIQEEGKPEESVPLSSSLHYGHETILLVEDEEMVRNLSRQALETCGYTVIEAKNGAEALEICLKSDVKLDLVMTDVVMPIMGGRELAERLTKINPNIKVLFTSGYTDDAIVRHGVINKGTNFLQKPFTFDSLAIKIRQLLLEPIENNPTE